MRHSSQCGIGGRAWRRAKCHEGDCQGAIIEDHSERAKAVKKAYSHIDDEDLMVDVLAGKCGPECNK